MNFKKTLAAVAASAIAVSAMATAAFADGYGDTFGSVSGEVAINGWTLLFDDCISTADAKAAGAKNNDMLIYFDGDASTVYLKVAGNDSSANWQNGKEGIVTEVWSYDEEAKCAVVPYSAWGVMAEIQLGIENKGDAFTVYGVTFANDTETIAEIEALMAGDSAAEDTTAEDTTATEAPADDANTDDTAAAGDTTEEGASKGNSDTGVEGVAAIAGLAIVAAGAVIVAKKRG